MQKFTQKYTIICLLEDVDEEYEFSSSSWPLHLTLADVFAIDWSEEVLKEKLVEIASTLKPVTSKATRDEYFGPNQDVHVVLVEKTNDLVSMHYHIVNLLKKGDIKFNNPQYSEEGFFPHSTVQKRAMVKPGDTVRVQNIALVDMFPDENPYQRKILKVVNLQQ